LTQSTRILPLDGLRAIAVTIVVLNHYFVNLNFRGREYIMPLLKVGWTGVDLFFVLSGFLVGGILLHNRSATNLLQVFYFRRALRILVPYFVFLSCAIATTYLFHIPWAPLRWIPFVLQIQPFYFSIVQAFTPMYLSITWTLGLEECFYVLFPITLLAFREKTIFDFCKVGIFAIPLLRLALYSYSEKFYVFTLFMRTEGLLMGVLLANEWRKPETKRKLESQKSKLFFLWVVAGAFTFYINNTKEIYPVHFATGVAYTFTATFYCTSVMLVLLSDPKTIISRLLASRPMVYIGQISYMVYLSHMLVHFWVTELTDDYSVPGGIKCGLITLGISALSWNWMEKKLLKLGHSFSYKIARRPNDSLNPAELHPNASSLPQFARKR
jgi:peptidoglycan/LPS O-acetylase OafA/YrhL